MELIDRDYPPGRQRGDWMALSVLAKQAGIKITVVARDGGPVVEAQAIIENHAADLPRSLHTDARGCPEVGEASNQ